VRFSFEAGDVISQVLNTGSPYPVNVVVTGNDLAKTRAHAEKIQAELARVPELRDLSIPLALDYPALKVEIGDLALAVFNLGGEFYVTDDTCTHGPGSLSEGYIEDDIVECNFHNGQFNIRTGAVVSPPCMVAVKTYPAMVVDGKVTIEM